MRDQVWSDSAPCTSYANFSLEIKYTTLIRDKVVLDFVDAGIIVG